MWSSRTQVTVVGAVLVAAVALASCGSADEMSVGDSVEMSIYVHCGVRYLVETIDGREWVAVDLDIDGIDPMPDDWADDESDSQRIDVNAELVSEDRLTITPTNGGRTVTYEPTETNPGCD